MFSENSKLIPSLEIPPRDTLEIPQKALFLHFGTSWASIRFSICLIFGYCEHHVRGMARVRYAVVLSVSGEEKLMDLQVRVPDV